MNALLPFVILAQAAQPLGTAELTSFDALKSALLDGQTVSVVLDYSKGILVIDGKEEPGPKAIGGMKFTPWEFFEAGVVRNDKAYFVASDTHLINHPRHGYVENYVRIRVYQDGYVEVLARYLKPGTYEILMDETFKMRILQSVRFFVPKRPS